MRELRDKRRNSSILNVGCGDRKSLGKTVGKQTRSTEVLYRDIESQGIELEGTGLIWLRIWTGGGRL